MSKVIFIAVLFSCAALLSNCSSPNRKVASDTAATRCNDSTFIYKVCTDQKEIYRQAFADAQQHSELLLITFGADWCPWCRALHSTFQNSAFIEKLPAKTRIVEIGMYIGRTQTKNPTGGDVLRDLIEKSKQQPKVEGFPFLAVVNPLNDKIAFSNTGDLEENTKETKGHSRAKLIEAITEMMNEVRK